MLGTAEEIPVETEPEEPTKTDESELELDLGTKVRACNSFAQINELVRDLSPECKALLWASFSSEEKKLIHEMKIRETLNLTEEPTSATGPESNLNEIQVGDYVFWEECWPYLAQWMPLQVVKVEGEFVKLEMVDTLIPLRELVKS